MKLISLTLQNFKGIKGFILDADGQNSNVFGNNGTGKSTLFDAFTWLLFGKNSRDEKDFGIKTLDPTETLSLGLNIVFPLSLNITDKSSSLLGHTKNAGANSVAPPSCHGREYD